MDQKVIDLLRRSEEYARAIVCHDPRTFDQNVVAELVAEAYRVGAQRERAFVD